MRLKAFNSWRTITCLALSSLLLSGCESSPKQKKYVSTPPSSGLEITGNAPDPLPLPTENTFSSSNKPKTIKPATITPTVTIPRTIKTPVVKTTPTPSNSISRSSSARSTNISHSWIGYPQPCLRASDAKILVEKSVPNKIKPEEEFSVKINVTNRAGYTVSKVQLTEMLPNGFKYISASPAPEQFSPRAAENSSGAKTLKWNIAPLSNGQTKSIVIKGKAMKTGTLRFTGDTRLLFELDMAKSEVSAVKADLRFTVSAPPKVVISEMIPVVFTFINNGKAELSNCKMIHTLPKGLITSEGRSKIELMVGDMGPGEKKQIEVKLKALDTKIYSTTYRTMAADGISAVASMTTEVTKPVLEITGSAPKKRFVGNVTPYILNVKNSGNAIAENVTIKLALPPEMKIASATENGQVSSGSVVWKVSTIHPGEVKELSARAVAKGITIVQAVAEASSEVADKVGTVMTTDVQGVSAIVTELIDLNDPVPVGETEIYEITAKNTGSLSATRIVVKCRLEDSMEYVESSGATKGYISGKTLMFESLPALGPQAEAKWRVVIKAKKAGDVRFAITVESDQLSRPIQIDEATHFYE